MAIEHFPVDRAGGFKITDLDGVTSATDGSGVLTRDYKDKTVFVTVTTTGAGAVTMTIQASHDGTTWFALSTKTYTASDGSDVYSYTDHFPYMRTITATHTFATVTTTICARS